MITKEDVLKIAHLAKLKLTDQEVELYQTRLGRILEHVNDLNSFALGDKVETVRHVPKDAVAFREDRPVPFEGVRDLLQNAPASEGNSFLLPQVLE